MTEPAAAPSVARPKLSSDERGESDRTLAPAAARTFYVETPQHRDMLAVFVGRRQLPFQAQIGPIREQRSRPQNARYWKLLSLAAEVTGYSAEEMHEFALCRHFGFIEDERSNPLTGTKDIVRIPRKRSRMRDKKEFAELMEATEAWFGTEFGCWLGADE